MTEQLEKLQHQLDQLRFLAADTTDPLALRLIADVIAELVEELTKEALPLRQRQKAGNTEGNFVVRQRLLIRVLALPIAPRLRTQS